MSDPCMCGRPIIDTANLCHSCADRMHANLHKIADRWQAMEQCLTEAAEQVDKSGQGKVKNGMTSVGGSINETVVRARRACTDVVWFIVQVVREDMDAAGRPFDPPETSPNRSQDDTPALARWVAARHLAHITNRACRDTAEEVARDLAAAEALTYKVVEVGPVKKVRVGLPCEQHGTSDMGERIPCPGEMEARLSRQMPDLVCTEDPSHRIPPDVWGRYYWKRAHVSSEEGARRLMDRLRG